MMKKLLLFTALILSSSMVLSGVYKWTDEEGNVHFGDRPETGEAEKVDMYVPHAPEPTEREKKARAEAEAIENRKEFDYDAKRWQQECADARKTLETYKTSNALQETLEAGVTRPLSEEDRQKLIEETEEKIKKYCTGVSE